MVSERDLLLQALNKQRAILARLEEQAAGFGSLHVPAHILVEIDDAKAQISQLEQRMAGLPPSPPQVAPRTGGFNPPPVTPGPKKPGFWSRIWPFGKGKDNTTAANPKSYRASLLSILTAHFTLPELRTLAFSLGLDDEELPHNTKSEFARELIRYFERANNLGALVNALWGRGFDAEVAQLVTGVNNWAPRDLVVISLSNNSIESKGDFSRKLAEFLGVSQEEVKVLAIRQGSIHLLVGLPREAAQRLQASGVRQLGGNYLVTNIQRYAALPPVQQEIWKQVTFQRGDATAISGGKQGTARQIKGGQAVATGRGGVRVEMALASLVVTTIAVVLVVVVGVLNPFSPNPTAIVTTTAASTSPGTTATTTTAPATTATTTAPTTPPVTTTAPTTTTAVTTLPLPTLKPLYHPVAVDGETSVIALNQSGTILAVRLREIYISLWSLPESKQLFEPLKGHGKAVLALAFSPDGKYLASSGADGQVILWEVATGKPVQAFKPLPRIYTALAFSPDSRFLAASESANQSTRLLDVATGKEGQIMDGVSGEVKVLAFSSDGKLLASGSTVGVGRVWEVSGGKLLAGLKGHSGAVTALAFSPDSKLLATGGADSTVRLWEAATGKDLGVLKGHQGTVGDLTFSPDGKTVVGGDSEGNIIGWPASINRPLFTLATQPKSVIFYVNYTKDGRLLVAAYAGKLANLWQVGS